MSKLVAIEQSTHKHLKFDPTNAELHGKDLNLVPVVVAEFTHVAVQFPLVLTKNADTGKFVFSAMLGFEQGENLFWEQERWQALYLPLQIRRQPFFIGSPSSSDFVACINIDSPVIIANDTAKKLGDYCTLYDSSGQETMYFQQAKQCLAQLLQGEIDNVQLVDMLEAYDLIQPLSLEVTFVNQQKSQFNGLYTIDQDRLTTLPSRNISNLHDKNLLLPIYTLITSLSQIYALIERKNSKFGS